MSWFWRGTQSAIFYYVSCVPCFELAHRRRRRKGAARSKAEKEMDQGPYPHPSPFSTNAYWQEEIAMGPGPPRKKKGQARRDKERKLWGDRGTADTENQRGLITANSTDTGASSADTMVAQNSLQGVTELEHERRSEGNWNRRRYQREDEVLWGFDDASEDGGEGGKYYTNVRNPSINDLHPPVVSTISSNRSETRWMLQPPPSAKFMEGKVRTNRSRSTSGGSNGSSKRGEPGLGRQLGERIMEEKRKRCRTSQMGSPAMSRTPTEESRTTSNSVAGGQRHERDLNHARPTRKSTESQSSTESSKSKPKATSVKIPADKMQHSNRMPPLVSSTKPTADNVLPSQRPQLQTINSSAAISPTVRSPPKSPHTPPRLFRPPLPSSTPSTSSLRALQELTPPSAALNSPRLLSMPTSSASKLGLPAPDAQEEEDLQIPEVETFWPGDYRFGATEVEGRRQQRWSMDI
ncbi:MAG: hypothetical protein Q9209_006704 [Squamulea sp. 1 TL-2023]